MLIPSIPYSLAYEIDTHFPGGNAVVAGTEGDTVTLTPDNRDSKPWFYWYFAVKGAAGKTLNFVFKPVHIGARGPAVSTDGGLTWKWMGVDAAKDGTFSYSFPSGANDVRFSVGMPYVLSDFRRLLSSYQGNPNIRLETLAKSRKDRDTPLLLIGAPNRKAKYTVAVTARHHACEMMASYVMEGIIQGILAEDERGRWLRDNVDFFFVPFVDMDGVEDGDQGKNRDPHDHNRDYSETIYPEVQAIKERLPAWTAGRPLAFFDIHDPALKADIHEKIQFLAGEQPAQGANLERFATLLERDQQGTILFRRTMIMKFGTVYNNLSEAPPPHAAGWARTLPNCVLASSIEMPYSNASGYEVNAESAREFGRDIAWALAAFFQEEPTPQTQP